jgi:polysaccharide export outer membrane protein
LLCLVLLFGPATFAESQAPAYLVGSGDVLRVTVWGHDNLSRADAVSPQGTLAFPLIGEVSVAGLTTAQVEARIRELLDRDYIVDPRVSVAVQEYRSQKVIVLGEVVKPGAYPLTGLTTLLDVLSQAGGQTPAAGGTVMVTRAPSESSTAGIGEALRVNLRKLLDGDPAANLRLQSGDTVFFPRMTSFFVLGEVQRQGAYAMERETTVLEAITLAGGFTDRAAPRGAKILRKRADGPQTTIDVDLSGTDARAREMVLVEGDTLMVPRGNVFFVAGEVRKPGIYLLDGSTSAFGALTLAGGLTERAAPAQGKLIRRGPSGDEQTLVLDLSGADPRAREVPLKDGDTLLIPAGDLFFVLGEVNKPGAFPLVGATTVVDGVLLAGGFTSRAAESKVKVTRRLPTGEEQVMVLDLSVPNSRGRDISLMAGDTVMIPTGTGATVYILGEVKSPGVFPLQDGTTTMQAVALAGGFTPKAAESKVKVTRRLPTGEEQVMVLDLAGPSSRGRDFPLMTGDTVTVPTGTGSTVYVLGEVKSPGAFPFQDGATTIQAIALAGGFTDRAAPSRVRIIRTREDGKQETLVMDANDIIKRGRKDKDVPLAANDVVVVPESLF